MAVSWKLILLYIQRIMGRWKRKHKGKGDGGKEKRSRDDNGDGRSRKQRDNSWTVVTSNEKFEHFYKEQNMFDTPEEWDVFMKHLRDPLPTTFRVTGTKSSAAEFRDMLYKRYLENLEMIEVEKVECFGRHHWVS